MGTAKAETTSQLCTIPAEGVSQLMCRHRLLQEVCCEYGSIFCRQLMMSGPPHSDYPDDLVVPNTEFADIVDSMNDEARLTISLNTLQKSNVSLGWRQMVAAEVKECLATVTTSSSGLTECNICQVLFEMERKDGALLFQIGKRAHDGDSKVELEQPGARLRKDESPLDLKARLMDGRMADILANACVDKSPRREVHLELSKWPGVQYRYVNWVFDAFLEADIEAPICRTCERRRTWFTSVPSSESLTSLSGGKKKSKNKHAGGLSRAAKKLFDTLRTRDVYCVGNSAEGDVIFYCWLFPQEVERLKRPGGDRFMLGWVSSLRVCPPSIRHSAEGQGSFISEISVSSSLRTDASFCAGADAAEPSSTPCCTDARGPAPWASPLPL